ncbi:MAG: hypothetical protein WD467_00695 [Candidatus Saccharimonadales bacterium]
MKAFLSLFSSPESVPLGIAIGGVLLVLVMHYLSSILPLSRFNSWLERRRQRSLEGIQLQVEATEWEAQRRRAQG